MPVFIMSHPPFESEDVDVPGCSLCGVSTPEWIGFRGLDLLVIICPDCLMAASKAMAESRRAWNDWRENSVFAPQ